MLTRFAAFRSLTAIKSPYSLIQVAGLKSFDNIPTYKDIDFPERAKLAVLPKVPQYPGNMKPFKMQKRLRYMRGPEPFHNTLQHRQFGIVADIGGRLKSNHIEMVRLIIARTLPSKAFAVWRVPAPWQPVTKKGHGIRMGGGKAAINHYVTPIKAGRVIIEVGGEIEFEEVKRTLTNIANKLPFKASAVSQDQLDEKQKMEEWYEQNNQNYWTFKYIVQNNLLGCSEWISPVDRLWFGKHR